MNQNEQLVKLLENSEKQLFYSRIRSIATVVTALCILCALVMVVPALLRTAAGADAVIAQASEGLNKAIKDLGDVVEPFAKFFNRFQ
ncbi:MAG: hypothetical protein HFI98_10410 [Lachnospiraceae bacterium]|nr:hypothetical protein [Lachnospiraceae bacterium]